MEHLSNPELQAFLRRDLSPVQLLELDNHLAGCQACRTALERESKAGALVASLQNTFALNEPHLEYEQLLSLAEGKKISSELEHHAVNCRSCRRELEYLRQFVTQIAETLRSSPSVQSISKPARVNRWRLHPVWTGLATAALIAGVAVLYWRASFHPAQVENTVATLRDGDLQLSLDRSGQLHGAEGLQPDERDALKAALATGRLPTSALPNLSGRQQETMLGPANPVAATFKVLSPINRVVMDDRPAFAWEPLPASSGYRVRIYAAGYRKVAESPFLRGTSWQSTVILPRGQVYTWTVTAEGPRGEVREPAPPQPEAAFQVMSADVAAEVDNALRNHSTDHLLLAVLYARGGAVAEARAQLDLLAIQNPNSPVDAQLKASLDQAVPSPIKTNAAQ